MAQQIEKVGVLGAGLMGHGIAQVAAQSGYEVVLREVDEATLAKGIGKIEKQLARAVEKGKSSQEDADAVRARIKGATTHYSRAGRLRSGDRGDHREPSAEARDVEGGRRDRQAGGDVRDEHLLACGDRSGRARPGARSSFVGLHYFNPAQVMKLVEVVRCVTSSDETFETAMRVRALGGQAGDPDEGQGGVHRQPAARSLHARRDARARKRASARSPRSTRR